MKTVVIAHYTEDLVWAARLPPKTAVHIISKNDTKNKKGLPKGIDYTIEETPNTGREPHSYLHYITTHYEDLEGLYFFTQGWPFDHEPEFLELVEELDEVSGFVWLGKDEFTCNPKGLPHDNNTPIHQVHGFWKQEPLPKQYTFKRGSILAVTADVIKQHPKELYEELLSAMNEGRAPWAMERLWGCLWGEEL